MSAAVLHMSDHRAVFVLPDVRGTVVFLASRGPSPRIAHERVFARDDGPGVEEYARGLSIRFGCSIVGLKGASASGEDVANG